MQLFSQSKEDRMRLDIQARGFTLTNGILNYTKQRMQFALLRSDNYITRVKVRLADINGPRGGVDKRCQIELAVAGHSNILIEDTEADLYFAIDRACERCMRTLARRLERLREHPHEIMPTVQ
jgi:ribosome-associated translation inhibitor RaiA